MSLAALLTLADQRLPSGGHVHSGGAEQAVAEGLITDAENLYAFLARRLATAGSVAAGLAAAAASLPVGQPEPAARLDAEADARTPSPPQRAASRAQGRGLLRTVRAAWPDPTVGAPGGRWAALGPRPHHPIVLGAAAAAAGSTPEGAALVAAYLSVTGPATAAQRLLGLDPVAVATVVTRLTGPIEAVARTAADRPLDPEHWPDLPDDADPLLDLLAQRQAERENALFAS